METVTEPAEHWDQTYGHGDTTRSWFQSEPVWSLRMLDRVGVGPADSVIDVGGGSSPFAAALLARGQSDLTVLDVSIIGMRAAQRRLGAAADRGAVALAEGDAATALPLLRNPACSTWCRLAWRLGMSGSASPLSRYATVSWSP